MVKRLFISLFAAIVTPVVAMADNTDHAGATDGYKLVWSDEFEGEALDENQWNIEVNGNGGGNNEMQYYRRENISIENHTSGARCLVLTARKEDFGGKKFTSGRLNSHQKVYFKHGKIESRILLPKTANGLWPAFWMMGNDYNKVGWPRCGETDILEMGNAYGISHNTQEKFFNGACHWGFYKNGAYPNYAKSTTNPYSIQDGEFHLFTCVWDENSIRMYLDLDTHPDASPYYEIGINGDNIDSDWSTALYFHKNNFIIYDLAVGGNFTGITGNNNADKITALADGEKKMYIDWVRVYQLEGQENIGYPGHPGTASDDNDYQWSDDPVVVNIPAAPSPTKPESEVVSLFSDAYINNHNFDYAQWWAGQATKLDVTADGDNMWLIKDFIFIGSEHDMMDLNTQKGLHMDIYPVDNPLQLGVIPICRLADDSGNEVEKRQEAVVPANQWSQLNFPISKFLELGLSMQRVYQLKLINLDNNGNNNYYIDNIYYYKGEDPTDGIDNILSPVTNYQTQIYNLAGQRVDSNYRGIVIKNGKKVIVK